MKKFTSIQHIVFTTCLTLAIVLAPLLSHAADSDKGLEKIKTEVREAAPDDWETLALAAEKCILRNTNLQEARSWLERSLQIKETSTALEIMGDYYLLNKLPGKALVYYVDSKSKVLERVKDFHQNRLDRKIAAANALRKKIG